MDERVQVLALADEVDPGMYEWSGEKHSVDLIVSCGDLPFDYLEYMVTMANKPLLYVPGNHDPDLSAETWRATTPDLVRPLLVPPIAVGMERRSRGPEGCTNIDGRVVVAGGLRVAGLGGSLRYSDGPNQYSDAQMYRRAAKLEMRARLRRWRRGLDVLVTHAPPRGVGDGDDLAHRGFRAFHGLVRRLRPDVLVHGHVHPYGVPPFDRRLGNTTVVNAVGRRVVEVAHR